MAENYQGQEPDLIPIEYTTFNLKEGPVNLALAGHELRIVVPARDLGMPWNADCAVIDPSNYDLQKEQGCQALPDGEGLVLGRDYARSRFKFPEEVSRHHARLSRQGNTVSVQDLGSTNGTYRIPALRYDSPTKQIVTTNVTVAGLSIASGRPNHPNRDAFFIDAQSQSLGVFDGVGHTVGSEDASQLAAEVILERLQKVSMTIPKELGLLAMRKALWDSHEAILKADPSGTIATTATVAKIFEGEQGTPFVAVPHAGDSRAWLRRNDQVACLTLDHVYGMPEDDDAQARHLQESLANATDLSKLDKVAQHFFHYRHKITSYLGGKTAPFITVSDFELRQGDMVFITSDGIHDNLTLNEIAAIARSQNTPATTVDALVEAAQKRSRDKSHLRAKTDDMTAAALML